MQEPSEHDSQTSDTPRTLGGHASHTGGAWILLLLLGALIVVLFK